MPTDGREKRNATMGCELVGDDAELANARTEVEALRELYQRIQQRQLEPGDWALLRAVIDDAHEELESPDASLTR